MDKKSLLRSRSPYTYAFSLTLLAGMVGWAIMLEADVWVQRLIAGGGVAVAVIWFAGAPALGRLIGRVLRRE